MTPSSGNLNEREVICPHCWHQYYPDQAYYIACHPELYDDAVLGPHEKKRLAPSEVTLDRNGVAFDTRGGRVTERACPNCHLQIPPELQRQRGKILSLVGAPSSGKTYFLTSMLHNLRSELTRNFGFSLRDSDSHEIRGFLEYEHKLFGSADPDKPILLLKTQEDGQWSKKVTLDGTDFFLPKPMIFSLTPTLSNPDLAKRSDKLDVPVVLYDNAGESFDFLKETNSSSRVTQHLGECDAVMFAFDPTLDSETNGRLKLTSSDPQVNEAARSYRQDSILTEVVNRMRRNRSLPPTKQIPVPLLICVQKYDIWKSLVPHATSISADGKITDNIDHTSVEFFESHGIAGLDVFEINRVSLLIRGFLQDISPSFVDLAESQFSTVRYFPVCALGTSPEVDPNAKPSANPREYLRVRPNRIQPFRVTHPFLWLMVQWKQIRPLKRMKPRKGIPHAIAEPVSGRIRVTMPGSGRVMVLDNDYGGSEIVDPHTGNRVWIPEVVVHQKSQVSESPRSQTNVNIESLRLKSLTPPPEKPKRGWFKK